MKIIDYAKKIKRSLIGIYIHLNILLSKSSFDNRIELKGVNVIGFIGGSTGLSQTCRAMIASIHQANLPCYEVDYIHRKTSHEEKLPYSINLIHLNPNDLSLARYYKNKATWKNKYNIGYWLWEQEEFPDEWVRCFKIVDEIWTPSEFVSDSIRKKTNLPVKTITHPILAETDAKYDRKHFDLPDDVFLYLCMFDSNSFSERKNPYGAINAYLNAFAQVNEKVGLVIKINNTKKEDLDKINSFVKSRTDIFIITSTLSKVEVNSLIKATDVLLSLHRSEGFGLPLAEAMMLGKPTVATNWSANLQFMNSERSCLVDYQFITLEKNIGLYKKGSRWADADISHASYFINKLFDDAEFYREISKNASAYMLANHTLANTSKEVRDRIKEILESNR